MKFLGDIDTVDVNLVLDHAYMVYGIAPTTLYCAPYGDSLIGCYIKKDGSVSSYKFDLTTFTLGDVTYCGLLTYPIRKHNKVDKDPITSFPRAIDGSDYEPLVSKLISMSKEKNSLYTGETRILSSKNVYRAGLTDVMKTLGVEKLPVYWGADVPHSPTETYDVKYFTRSFDGRSAYEELHGTMLADKVYLAAYVDAKNVTLLHIDSNGTLYVHLVTVKSYEPEKYSVAVFQLTDLSLIIPVENNAHLEFNTGSLLKTLNEISDLRVSEGKDTTSSDSGRVKSF